jgi:gas vesicle protein
MERNNGVMKGLAIGLLAGGAIGAIVALLYAPKSGKELRADIKERADDLLEDAEGYAKEARSKASDIMTEAKRRSDHLITKAQEQANTLLQDADKILSGAKQKTGVILEEGAKLKDAVKAGVEAFKDERNRTS